MRRKLLGRDLSCDFVIIDPENRVSRKHAEIYHDGKLFFVKDLNSRNGTYINEKKINQGQTYKIESTDRLTLSKDYVVTLKNIFPLDEEETKILQGAKNIEATVTIENDQAIFRNYKQTVVFDRDKTQIGELSQLDCSPFVMIGRSTENDFPINNNKISKHHCKLRLLTPVMLEVIDLGSTNGTFADDKKLIPHHKYQYSSAVNLRLGSSYLLNLREIFPQIQIVQKISDQKKTSQTNQVPANTIATEDELNEFLELEEVWKTYLTRQNEANKAAGGFSIGGAVIGLAAAVLTGLTGGIGGVIMISGGGLIGRYLGQQKSNEIRDDLTFEDMFLEIYACPRCNESFQKKPWITIRECMKCRTKFR